MTTPAVPAAPAAPATPEASEAFGALLREAMTGAERFGHRQHVRLTWLAVRRHGAGAALDLIADGILRTATAAGAPGKFHVTMTRAWVELVAHHVGDAPDSERHEGLEGRENHEASTCFKDFKESEGFEEFAARHPELLDKELLARHYRPGTLADERARTTWVEPDLAPFPRAVPVQPS
ncbi:hypothetical protein GCM10018790_11810 [Kitasatospora xanthocidica]|uniref:hypothetical protein n=1 Tax=Kitasatospora xanthocidica TaxID=83382 RepID=UPI0019BE2C07|nr:hypothetical protein [Kitasatospora xanthocidica]GHF35588.1 hypothetical protein GCM10018790_11810 [Kitasatospora xanthocidica]